VACPVANPSQLALPNSGGLGPGYTRPKHSKVGPRPPRLRGELCQSREQGYTRVKPQLARHTYTQIRAKKLRFSRSESCLSLSRIPRGLVPTLDSRPPGCASHYTRDRSGYAHACTSSARALQETGPRSSARAGGGKPSGEPRAVPGQLCGVPDQPPPGKRHGSLDRLITAPSQAMDVENAKSVGVSAFGTAFRTQKRGVSAC
jgi:hypothetical protein